MEIIIGRQGNQKTPITDPTVSRRHCKVTVNSDGTVTVENLSATGTKIDGREIIHTTVSPDTVVQLGPSFSAKISDLIAPLPSSSRPQGTAIPGAAGTSQSSSRPTPAPRTAQPEPKTFRISHLRKVWEDFNETNLRLADEQRRTNLTRTGLGIFTMCAMPTIFFFGPLGYVLTGIGVVGNIYSFVGMKNSETPAERQKRQEEFDDAWVCPNPECGRSLIAKNYKHLIRNFDSCPYCKCRYIE